MDYSSISDVTNGNRSVFDIETPTPSYFPQKAVYYMYNNMIKIYSLDNFILFLKIHYLFLFFFLYYI